MKSIDKLTRESLKPNFLTRSDVEKMANSPEFMQKLMGGLKQSELMPSIRVSKSGATYTIDSESSGLTFMQQ